MAALRGTAPEAFDGLRAAVTLAMLTVGWSGSALRLGLAWGSPDPEMVAGLKVTSSMVGFGQGLAAAETAVSWGSEMEDVIGRAVVGPEIVVASGVVTAAARGVEEMPEPMKMQPKILVCWL